MQGLFQLSNLFRNVIATGLVKEIYHSVIIREDNQGQRKPFAPVDNKYVYVGVNDTKGFSCYCRPIGPMESLKEEKVGSNSKIYTMQVPHRLVFYNDNETRSQDGLIAILLTAILSSGDLIKFQRVNTLAETILQSEAPTGSFFLKTSAFYVAFDFYVLLKVQNNNCGHVISCEKVRNPFTKDCIIGPDYGGDYNPDFLT